VIISSPPTWIELRSSAFNHNVKQFKQIVGRGALALVLKSNAYGHGMREIAQLAEKNSEVDWLCVARLTEALLLRSYGITKSILVLSFIDTDPALALNQAIECIVSDYHTAVTLDAVGRNGGIPFPIHVKIDTGLSRFGVMPDELISFMQQLDRLPYITVRGIATHCAESNSADRTFTLQQLALFDRMIAQLDNANYWVEFKHVANSAATLGYALPNCNFFRVGLGILGYWPSRAIQEVGQQRHANLHLQPVLQWKTRLAHIKKIPKHSSVGYFRTFVAQRDTVIGLLPLGYADGYNPGFSNRVQVRINGSLVPVIGRIAMNVCMVDLTDIAQPAIGAEVLLMGDDPDLNVSQFTSYVEIPNERYITTTICRNIPRIIV
jgi:alanine racemase